MHQAALKTYPSRPAFLIKNNRSSVSSAPNAETLQAIVNARAKHDTVVCKDSQALFKALDI